MEMGVWDTCETRPWAEELSIIWMLQIQSSVRDCRQDSSSLIPALGARIAGRVFWEVFRFLQRRGISLLAENQLLRNTRAAWNFFVVY
jgi:hypothetical protein